MRNYQKEGDEQLRMEAEILGIKDTGDLEKLRRDFVAVTQGGDTSEVAWQEKESDNNEAESFGISETDLDELLSLLEED